MTPAELDVYFAERFRALANGLDPMCTCGHPRSWHRDGAYDIPCLSPDPSDTCCKFRMAS